MSFLAEAGYLLSSSLDYRQTLAQLARLSVPDLADWCSVDMLSEEGDRIERLAVAHVDPAMAAWAQELGDRYPPRLDSPYGVPKVLRTGEADFVPTIDDELLVAASEGDEEFLALVRKLELRSAITVPLAARDRVLGALSLVRTRSAPAYTETELGLALELARRAGQAVDNALLLRQTQRAADAARALAHVADAVVLVDEGGFVRYWNAAAERMLGPAAVDVLGRRGADAERVREIVGAIPLAEDAPGITIPLASPDGERWLSVRVTRFDHGAVYALRDVTGEHQLERLRSEFVATASHELRTPLAAVYGAIRSLRRTDVVITDEQREAFLAMIETEAEKLRSLVDQLLVVGQLDANAVKAELRAVQLGPVVGEVVRAARVTAPPAISFEIDVDGAAPALADPELLRQILGNLVDNAVKYSPSGGVVAIATRTDGDHVTLTVADQGLGIPLHAQPHIFEKFFRVDPELRRGVGGTGLGLYIASELARRIGGRLAVDSADGEGSTFSIELRAAPRSDRAAAEAEQRLAGLG
jgi:PAS domain S-box-containing protein